MTEFDIFNVPTDNTIRVELNQQNKTAVAHFTRQFATDFLITDKSRVSIAKETESIGIKNKRNVFKISFSDKIPWSKPVSINLGEGKFSISWETIEKFSAYFGKAMIESLQGFEMIIDEQQTDGFGNIFYNIKIQY